MLSDTVPGFQVQYWCGLVKHIDVPERGAAVHSLPGIEFGRAVQIRRRVVWRMYP
jgi:hypothetical protein